MQLGFLDSPRTTWALCFLGVAAAVYFWFRPEPGAGIAALGAAAALMSFLKVEAREKAMWMFVVFALLWVELRAINKDREDAEVQQRASRAAITEARNRIEALADLSTQNLNQETGGNSFCYLTFTKGYFTEQSGTATFVNQGEYPLYDVAATVVNLRSLQSAAYHAKTGSIPLPFIGISVGNIPAHSAVTWRSQPIALDGAESERFSVNFVARNGSWFERIALRRKNGQWSQAISVSADGRVGAPARFERIDPGLSPSDLDGDGASHAPSR